MEVSRLDLLRQRVGDPGRGVLALVGTLERSRMLDRRSCNSRIALMRSSYKTVGSKGSGNSRKNDLMTPQTMWMSA